MNHKNYYLLVGSIIGLVSLAHLTRAILGVDVSIAGWSVPLWLSWVGFVVAAYVSYVSFRFASGK
jgi:hypothetical protein